MQKCSIMVFRSILTKADFQVSEIYFLYGWLLLKLSVIWFILEGIVGKHLYANGTSRTWLPSLFFFFSLWNFLIAHLLGWFRTGLGWACSLSKVLSEYSCVHLRLLCGCSHSVMTGFPKAWHNYSLALLRKKEMPIPNLDLWRVTKIVVNFT